MQQHGHVLVGDAGQVRLVRVDRHGDLEHLASPNRRGCCRCRGSRGVAASSRRRCGAAIRCRRRRGGSARARRSAGRFRAARSSRGPTATVGGRFAFQPAHDVLRHVADRPCGRGSGRSCRPVARARSRARIAARPGRRTSCRRGCCRLPASRSRWMTRSASFRVWRMRRAFGQIDVHGEDVVQILGEEGRAEQRQATATPSASSTYADAKHDRLVIQAPRAEAAVERATRAPRPPSPAASNPFWPRST